MTERRLSGLIERLADRAQLIADRGAVGDADGDGPDAHVGVIRYDSRTVEPGDVFVARRGQHADGHDHAVAAVARGAIAVVGEHPVADVHVPQLIVNDARIALGIAAAWRACDPSYELGIVGITGTDGKTTTAYLVRAILEATGRRSGLLGTTDVIVGGRSFGNAARTSTPEAPELQAYLSAMRGAGDTWAVVESTSHGLAQERVSGVAYDVGVLTNITAEHLEFHGTLEAYRAAKLSLFSRLAAGDANPDKGWGKHAVINADDPVASMAGATAAAAGATVLLYGSTARRDATAAGLDMAAVAHRVSPAGIDIELSGATWSGSVLLPLAGRFNVYNALAALGVAAALGLDLDVAATALASVESVPGRMQRIDDGQPFTVVIDYAHTADALAKVLAELAPSGPDAGVIAVFGSAGDRDVSKREVMGRVAGERCRLVVLADEDPRSEDRMAILEAIAAGAVAAGKHRGEDLWLIPDRAEAIAAAIAAARPGDVVLLAGKGHEQTIEMADGELDWDETAAARDAIAQLASR